MIRIMELVHQLLLENIHVTKRDLYYTDVPLFENQNRTDEAIENLAVLLQIPRNSLHIVASQKGVVGGLLSFYEGSTFVDVSKYGVEVFYHFIYFIFSCIKKNIN